jgi:hypothetical protein
MEMAYVGIDVSKDRLDIHVLPEGETFAELPELGTLDGKRIASLAGLAPFTRQSGQWKGKAMIAGGRKSVRAALFLASLVACRHNPVLKAFRRRLIDAGKPKMLVVIARLDGRSSGQFVHAGTSFEAAARRLRRSSGRGCEETKM